MDGRTSLRDRLVQVIRKHPQLRQRHEIDVILPWLTKRTEILRAVDNSVLIDLVARCEYLQAERDDVIIKQGEKGNSFYIILTGTVSVYIDTTKSGEDDADNATSRRHSHDPSTTSPTRRRQSQHTTESGTDVGSFKPTREEIRRFEHAPWNKKLDRNKFGKFIIRFGEGKGFGEIALMSENNVRNASIICDDDTDFMVVNRQLYNQTLKSHQERQFEEIRQFVDNHPLFRRWSERFRRLLEMSLIKENHSFDTPVIKQGEPWGGLVFIRKGRARVEVEPGRHDHQYPALSPFIDHDDMYEEERLRPARNRKPKHFEASLQQDHVTVRRRAGYAAAERRRFLRTISLCMVDEGEIFGDTEVVMGLDTYLHTVTCTTATEVYVLTPKNFERLISRRNPHTMDMLKMMVETKTKSRLGTTQGNQVPIYKHILFKLTRKKRAPPRTIPPLRGSKELPDREVLFEHLMESFRQNKAELVEPYVPGAVYYREMMRERAKIRDNIREKQKKRTGIEPTFRTKRRLNVKRARTTKELKRALDKQKNANDETERRNVLHEIRRLEEDIMMRDYQELLESKDKISTPVETKTEEVQADGEKAVDEDTDVQQEVSETTKTATFLEDLRKAKPEESSKISSKLPTVMEVPESASPRMLRERTKTFVTELTESEPGDLQIAREGSNKEERDVHSAQADYPDLENTPADNQPQTKAEPTPEEHSKPMKKDRARMKFLQAIVRNKLHIKTSDNPTYRDWETSDRSMRYLEERVRRFTTNTGEYVGLPPPAGLPKLQRFQLGPEVMSQPRPGGKVYVRRSECALSHIPQRVVDHEHVRYRMVPSLPQYEQLRRQKMMVHMALDDVRERWVKTHNNM